MIPNRPSSADSSRGITSSGDQAFDDFSRDVLKGLTATPKSLPPKYFYDELGSILFEAICRIPEYYVTRDEDQIVRARTDEIIGECISIPTQLVNLIELGSGSSGKTRHMIEALLRQDISVCYRAIDVSTESLKQSENGLLRTYPNLRFVPYPFDYFTALDKVAKDLSSRAQTSELNIGIFFGSSIGNLEPKEAINLLQAMHRVLRPQDSFVMGADLKKPNDILLPAYNDKLGITAAFNLNLLVRINRELGGRFDLNKFEHRALFNERESRIEMHLFSREKQHVYIKALELKTHFEEGESIHTENSYKFELRALSSLVKQAGFSLTKTWFDTNQRFSLNLLKSEGRESLNSRP